MRLADAARHRLDIGSYSFCPQNHEAVVNQPDFFIIGAPKCGTTALYEYLRRHPQVFVPPIKELHYFGSDLCAKSFCRNESQYLANFASAGGAKAIGEASVWYLYSELAAQEIRQFAPHARIIAMVRQPVDMLYSQHSQFLYNGNEDIEDFVAALSAESDRRRGHRIPRNVVLKQGLYYSKTAEYAPQIERYFRVFGRERVHVILYDDFKSDTRGTFSAVLRFLGVDDSVAVRLEVINPNKRVRSTLLRGLLHSPSRWMRVVTSTVLPTPELRRRVWRTLNSVNTRYEPRAPLSPDLRAQLTRRFVPDIRRLEELLGRDLRHWMEAG